MKIKKIVRDVGFISLLTLATAWVTNANADDSTNLRSELSHLIARCAVQPVQIVDGIQTFESMVPSCPAIQANHYGFRLELSGKFYELTGKASKNSDGNDLMDLQVSDLSGKVLISIQDVLCFGDLLEGLVGSAEKISQISMGTPAQ